MYFLGFLLIWTVVSVEELTGLSGHCLKNPMENMQGTVAVCLTLAMFFVGFRCARCG